ncbi:MAG: serine/threonine-protein kinase, partial [Thermoanaerobaculia bacterium]
MPLASGTKLGPYEIVGPIGAGGMGEVYHARDSRLQRSVAIKIIPETADPTAVARFESEAHAASSLNHPHILTIFEFGRAESASGPRDYIAMELIEGETLRARIARQRDLAPMLDLLIQIGDALARAHEANIVHRDLKPDNIMVTADGYAKILDFGLAKLVVEESDPDAETLVARSAAGTFVGTVGYAAPEQLRGEMVDARSDIFSFGCVVYEAATGRRPFVGASFVETAQLTVTTDPAPLRSFEVRAPADLQRIISRCLAKEPQHRYASMRDVVAHLKRVREELRGGRVRAIPRLTQITFDRAIEQFPAISADGTRVA